jgi:hypothetical protein
MKEIARRLGVSVSSVSLWVRDIELSPEQRAALRNKVSGGSSANAVAARRRRILSQEGGRALVRDADHLFADHLARQREIEQFWLDTLELPQSCLRKSIVNVYSKYSQRKRKGRLPYGTCRLVVCDTAILQSIYGAIQEYAGFDRPEWLG